MFKKSRKAIAVLLAAIIIVGMLPTVAMAEGALATETVPVPVSTETLAEASPDLSAMPALTETPVIEQPPQTEPAATPTPAIETGRLTIEAFEALEKTAYQMPLGVILQEVTAQLPQTLNATVAGRTEQIPVTWTDGGAYDPHTAGVYAFQSVIDANAYAFEGATPSVNVISATQAQFKVTFSLTEAGHMFADGSALYETTVADNAHLRAEQIPIVPDIQQTKDNITRTLVFDKWRDVDTLQTYTNEQLLSEAAVTGNKSFVVVMKERAAYAQVSFTVKTAEAFFDASLRPSYAGEGEEQTQTVSVDVQKGETLSRAQIPAPTMARTDIAIKGWQDEKGTLYATADLVEHIVDGEKFALTAVVKNRTTALCTCKIQDDDAANHYADCGILKVEEFERVYAKKAAGVNGDALPEAVEVPNSKLDISKLNTDEKTPAVTSDAHLMKAFNAKGGEPTTSIVVPRGYVYLAPDPAQKNAAGTYVWYNNVTDALGAMNSSETSYQIVIAKDGYTLTPTECNMYNMNLADRANSISISTSWKDPAGADTLWDRNPSTWAPGETSLGYQGSPKDAGILYCGASIQCGVDTTFRNIIFGSSITIGGMMHKLTMGEGVTSNGSTNLNIHGATTDGNYKTIGAKLAGDTFVEVFSGRYQRILGGYFNAPAKVLGGKTVNVYGAEFISAEMEPLVKKENAGSCILGGSLFDNDGRYPPAGAKPINMLIRPMKGLAFVPPYSIGFSAMSGLNATDTCELIFDTRYYEEADMSKLRIAALFPTDVTSTYTPYYPKGTRIKIYAPDTSIGFVAGRYYLKGVYSDYSFPSEVSVDEAAYINVLEGIHNSAIKYRSSVKDAIINIKGKVQVGTLQYYTDCNLAEDAKVLVTTFHGSGERLDEDSAYRDTLAKEKIRNLKLGKNSSLEVLKGYLGCEFGNIWTAENGQLILTSNGVATQSQSEASILSGDVFVQDGNKLKIGLSANSVAGSSQYSMMYSGNRDMQSRLDGKVEAMTPDKYEVKYAPHDGTPNAFLVLEANDTAIYQLSTEDSVPEVKKCANLAEVYTALKSGAYKGKYVKLTVLNNTTADFYNSDPNVEGLNSITIDMCKGIILTGWMDDYGYNIEGDGQRTTSSELAGGGDEDAGDGSAAIYKSVAPPDAKGLHVASNIVVNVPFVMRNIGLNLESDRQNIMSSGYFLQMGPGLDHTGAMIGALQGNIGGEKLMWDGPDDASFSRGCDVRIYCGKYMIACGLGFQYSNAGVYKEAPGKMAIYGGTYDNSNPRQTGIYMGSAYMLGNQSKFWCSSDLTLKVTPTDGYSFNIADNLGVYAAFGSEKEYNENNWQNNLSGNVDIYIKIPESRPSYHFSYVAPLYYGTYLTQYSETFTKQWTITIDAPNCTFDTVANGNTRNDSRSIMALNYGPRILNLIAGKFAKVYGADAVNNGYYVDSSLMPKLNATVNIGGKKSDNGDTANRVFDMEVLKAFTTLNIQNGATVNVGDDNDSFFNRPAGTDTYASEEVEERNVVDIKEGATLNLNAANNNYGIYNLKSSDNTGHLNVKASTSGAGLRIKGKYLGTRTEAAGGAEDIKGITLGLVNSVTAAKGLKLLVFKNSDAGTTGYSGPDKAAYHKGAGVTAYKWDFLTSSKTLALGENDGMVRLYPSADGKSRSSEFVSLKQLLDALKDKGLQGEDYVINFFKAYTITLEDAQALKEFPKTGIKSLTIVSLNQVSQDILAEGKIDEVSLTGTPMLHTIDVAEGVKLELPTAEGVFKGVNGGVIYFESFAFGDGINALYADGCNVTLGARKSGFTSPHGGDNGSVRMGKPNDDDGTISEAASKAKNFMLYAGSAAGGGAVAADPTITVHSGYYKNIVLGGVDSAVNGTATLNLNGGVAECISNGLNLNASSGSTQSVVNVANTITLHDIYDLDKLSISADAVATFANDATLHLTKDNSALNGLLDIGNNAVLELTNTTGAQTVAKLNAQAGAALYIPKTAADGNTNPLRVTGSLEAGTAPLHVDVKETTWRKIGDHLLWFNSTKPETSSFYSVSMGIKNRDDYPAATENATISRVILYGEPQNPQVKLWLAEMPAAYKGEALTKKLWFDTFSYNVVGNDVDKDGAKVDAVYLLDQAQYTLYLDKGRDYDFSETNYIAVATEEEGSAVNDAQTDPDGVGKGSHTHYYFCVEPKALIDERQSYYAVAKAGTGDSLSYGHSDIDIKSPAASPLTPDAVKENDTDRFKIDLTVTDTNDGRGMARAAWSTNGKLFDATVPQPGLSKQSTTPPKELKPANPNLWTDETALSEVTEMTGDGTYTLHVDSTGPLPPKLYLYAQDKVGNTSVTEITPKWGMYVEYQPGDGKSTVTTPADGSIRNVMLKEGVSTHILGALNDDKTTLTLTGVGENTGSKLSPEGGGTFTAPENLKFIGWELVSGTATKTVEESTVELKAGDLLQPDDVIKQTTYVVLRAKWESACSLNVSKLVTGAYADHTRKFSFDMTVTKADGTALAGKELRCEGSVVKDPDKVVAPTIASLKTDKDGKAAFELSHGQQLKIKDLPSGAVVVIRETNTSSYKVSYTLDSGVEVTAAKNEVRVDMSGKEERTLVMINELDIVPTGFALSDMKGMPVILAGLAAFAVSALAAGGILLVKKRKYIAAQYRKIGQKK